MTNETTMPVMEKTQTSTQTSYAPWDPRWLPTLCWGAIIGGTVAAIGIHILLSMLGTAAGLAAFSPMTDANPTTTFSESTAAIWSICALVSVFFGAVIAGRFSQTVHGGFVHGILVWSLTLIITAVLLMTGATMFVGGGLKVLGEGIGLGTKAVSSGVNDVAQAGIKRNGNELNSFIDEATKSIPTNAAPKVTIRAQREVGLAVMKLFAPENDINSQENKQAAVKALVDYTQMSQADAQSTVDGWIASYQDLKAQLDQAKSAGRKSLESSRRSCARQPGHCWHLDLLWSPARFDCERRRRSVGRGLCGETDQSHPHYHHFNLLTISSHAYFINSHDGQHDRAGRQLRRVDPPHHCHRPVGALNHSR